MNVHEYQAKQILKKYGVLVDEFAVVSTLAEVEEAINHMSLDAAVIKVQVHAGGRGKAGGVKIAKSREEILSYAEQLLGMHIINNQTGPEGVVAHQILISPLASIKKEYYLGAVIDRKQASAALIASPEGGMEIEEVAAKNPEAILKMPIGFNGTLRSYQLWNIAKFMGWQGATAKQGMKTVAGLAKAFVETDASLLEINPLVETTEGNILAIDAKLSIDNNALFRQKEIAELFDPTQLSKTEVLAKEHDLAYIALDGNIGCLVNGAGLAMATMDIIGHYGGKPANFLDVGGGASQEKVAEGFKIILSDPLVKAVFLNIFGGIMNCEVLAAGILAANEEIGGMKVPLVVRMAGTNVKTGTEMLQKSGLNIIIADSMADGAEKVVNCKL